MATQMEFSENSVDFLKQSYSLASQEHIPHGGSVPSNILAGRKRLQSRRRRRSSRRTKQ